MLSINSFMLKELEPKMRFCVLIFYVSNVFLGIYFEIFLVAYDGF